MPDVRTTDEEHPYSQPQLITGQVLEVLRQLIPIDPDHMPQALDAIQAVGHIFPDVPQVACFDTAFHRHMPHVAQMYALPREISELGVVRYGFLRERICAGLEHLGIHLDAHRNTQNAPIISEAGSPVSVRVIPTTGDLMIARHTYHLIAREQGTPRVSV